MLSFFAHIAGAVGRYAVNTLVYGTGDSFRYLRAGGEIAGELRAGNLDVVFGGGFFWGSRFIDSLSGILQLVLGENMLALSMAFMMLGFVGCLMMALAFARSMPNREWRRGASLVLLWPSLCFWPSTIGKEAVILLALGLVVSGWRGDGKSPWPLRLAMGLLLALCIRPHVAMMFAVCLAAAEWLAPVKQMTPGRIARAIALGVVALAAVAQSLDALGVEAQLEAVATFAADRAGRTQTGGSRIAVVGGPFVVPMAFVNVLLRPFLWEVRNPVMLISAAEILLMWWLLLKNRKLGLQLLSAWRYSRLLLFVVPATVVLTIFYGAFVSNLGILARQRVVILPLLFCVVEIGPAMARMVVRSSTKHSQRAKTKRSGTQSISVDGAKFGVQVQSS